MKKLNYLFTGIIAIVLMLGLCLYLTKYNTKTVHATELEDIDGAELQLKLKLSGKDDCIVTFENGRYLHLQIDTNQAVVNNNPDGADIEYYNGVLRIFDDKDIHEDIDEYDERNISIYGINASDKKLTIMLENSFYFSAIDFPKGDLTITTAEGVDEKIDCFLYSRIVINGTLTIAGNICLNYWDDFGWNNSVNNDATANITADTLQVVDNASMICKILKDADSYAIKVNYFTINTTGSVNIMAPTDNYLKALRVDSDSINLINCKQFRISATTEFETQKDKLTNVMTLLNAPDTPIENFYATCERDDDDWVLTIVPDSALHTISFDANGGTGEMADVENVYYNYAAPKCTFTAPEGKKFNCWAVGSLDGTKVTEGNSFVITEDTTLYAIWMNQVPKRGEIRFGFWAGKSPSESAYSYDQETGTLTIKDNFNYDIFVNNSNNSRSNIIISFDGVHNYGAAVTNENKLFISNPYGDITLVNNGEEAVTVYLVGIYTNYSLTIKGKLNVVLTGTNDANYRSLRNIPERGLIYAQDKFSILENASLSAIDPALPTNCQSYSSIVAAGSIEIDTTGEVEIGTTAQKYDNNKNANICILEASRDEIINRIIIKQCGNTGYFKLYRYNVNSYYFIVISNGSTFDTTELKGYARFYEQNSDYSETAKLSCLKPVYINFDKDGGTGEMARDYSKIGYVYTLPECAFTAPTGFEFGGWRINGDDYQSGATYDIPSDTASITFTAIWLTIKEDVDYIDFVQITGPTKKDVKEGNLESFTAESKTNHVTIQPYGSGTCWVYWNASTSTWCEFEGTPVAVTDGTRYGVRLACNLEAGYEFSNLTVMVVYNTTISDVVDDHNIEKHNAWGGYIFIDLGEANPVYTVTYYPNGGTGTDVADCGIIAGSYKLKTYTELSFAPQAGKQFKGWSYTTDGEIINKTSITIDGNKELYAIWEDIPAVKYTVSFNANGGKGKMASIQYGGTYPLPTCEFEAPSGYEFAGWATSKDGEVITKASITIDSDVTLYAKWEASGEGSQALQPEAKKGLAPVAIVFIVLGSVIIVGAGAFAIYWFVIKKKTWADFVQIFKKK